MAAIELALNKEQAALVLRSIANSIKLMQSDSRHADDIRILTQLAAVLRAQLKFDVKTF
jgi:hypothetical protein